MTVQFFDGCDDYGTTNQAAFISRFGAFFGSNNNSTGVIGAMPGPYGGYAISTDGLAALVPVSGAPTVFTTGSRFYYTNLANNRGCGLSFVDTTGKVLVQCALYDTGSVAATLNGSATYSGSLILNGTALGSITYGFQAKVWYEFEAQLTVGSGTSGSLIVKINGVTVLNLTNINTQGTAGSSIGGAGVICGTYVSAPQNFYDDMYGVDSLGSAPTNTFLTTIAGPMGPRVSTQFPSADAQKQWTPGSGSTDFSNINEASFDGDLSTISSNTVGNQDLYTVPATTRIANILAVQTAYVVRDDDSGSRSVSGSIKSGSTIYQGATKSLTANYQKIVDVYVNDPATNAVWVPSKLNNAQIQPGILLVS